MMAPSTVRRPGPHWVAVIPLLVLGVTLPAQAQPSATGPAAQGPAQPASESPEPPASDSAAPASDSAAPAKDSALDFEAAALSADLLASTQPTDFAGQLELSVYGFTDFTFSKSFSDFDFSKPSFFIGNLNLYLASDLGDNFRSLAEVRFMYLPNGAGDFGDPTAPLVDTTVADYTDFLRPKRWGGISIERAWIEYAPHPAFTLRAGHWLTPYGIWNVDHGSPVIIGVRRPYLVGESLLPQSQTGFELYGSVYIDATQIGYHLTLSASTGVRTLQCASRDRSIDGASNGSRMLTRCM
jgi:hypothetical protein